MKFLIVLLAIAYIASAAPDALEERSISAGLDERSRIICIEDGYMPHPYTCRKYIYCVNGRPIYYTCWNNLIWNQEAEKCVPGVCTSVRANASDDDFICPSSGKFAHATDKQKYYVCIVNGGFYMKIIKTCRGIFEYNEKYGKCTPPL